MNKSYKNVIKLFLIMCLFSLSYNVFAGDRVAIIKGLKLKGLIGENNKGLLEFRTADRAAEGIVNEENAERSRVYSEIGQKSGVSSENVGKQRAAQIAGEEPGGVWIQNADGSWFKK